MLPHDEIARVFRRAAHAALDETVIIVPTGDPRKAEAHRVTGRVTTVTRTGFVVQGPNYRVFISYTDLYCRHLVVRGGTALGYFRAALDTLHGAAFDPPQLSVDERLGVN
jgi:hypothetical protein